MKKVIPLFLMLCLTMLFPACGHSQEATTEAEVIEDLTGEAEGVMSYEEFQLLSVGEPVVIDVSVKEKISWEDYKATIIAADQDVSYILTDVVCSEEAYENLRIGSRIRVAGYKGQSGDKEQMIDVVFEELEQ